jgi:hypothetical protein
MTKDTHLPVSTHGNVLAHSMNIKAEKVSKLKEEEDPEPITFVTNKSKFVVGG